MTMDAPRTQDRHANSVHQLAVDHSEARSELLHAVRRNGTFDVRLTHLPAGDYLINDDVLIERKSVADFAALAEVRGVGPKKAARIRELVGPSPRD